MSQSLLLPLLSLVPRTSHYIVNSSSAILDQVGTSCNRQFGVRAQVLRTACFCNFVPLMFLQGPYFSEEGALGLPKAKSW